MCGCIFSCAISHFSRRRRGGILGLSHWHVRDELELELIQTHTTQKPLLWVEVGAHAVRKRSECAGVVWAGAGVVWR
jgi:hypothetical protein